jgi:hypothetical protein
MITSSLSISSNVILLIVSNVNIRQTLSQAINAIVVKKVSLITTMRVGAPVLVGTTISKVFVYGSMIGSVATIILMSSSYFAFFALTNQLQIILVMIALNMYFTDEVLYYLLEFEL